jgi:hypothetical protein
MFTFCFIITIHVVVIGQERSAFGIISHNEKCRDNKVLNVCQLYSTAEIQIKDNETIKGALNIKEEQDL